MTKRLKPSLCLPWKTNDTRGTRYSVRHLLVAIPRQFSVVIVVGLLLLGLWMAYYPLFLSGFERSITDPGDSRLVQYILEHAYLWTTGNPLHHSLWNVPVFFPAKNVATYTDVMLSVAPPYWLLRAVGLSSLMSFQFWMILMSVFNFGAALFLFRRVLNFSWMTASLGAFFVSFASPRLAQLGHLQLLPQFYVILAFACLIKSFQNRKRGVSSPLCVLGFFVFIALQAYAGFYQVWFLSFGLFVWGLFSLLFSKTRQLMIRWFILHWRACLASSALAFLALYPLFYHYYLVSKELGFWGYGAVFWLLPTWQSWFYHGTESFLYAWEEKLKIFRMIPLSEEKKLGLGLVFSTLCCIGFWKARKDRWIKPLVFSILFIVLITTLYPKGINFWEPFHDYFPGAKAIRALCRVGLFLILPLTIGFMIFFENSFRRTGVIFLVLLAMAEQARSISSYSLSEVTHEADLLSKKISATFSLEACDSFFVTPHYATALSNQNEYDYHRQAMWASLRLNKPTINGYSSRPPRGWDFQPNFIKNRADEVRIQGALKNWAKQNALNFERICWYHE